MDDFAYLKRENRWAKNVLNLNKKAYPKYFVFQPSGHLLDPLWETVESLGSDVYFCT